jgi:hypothetical protein
VKEQVRRAFLATGAVNGRLRPESSRRATHCSLSNGRPKRSRSARAC